MLGTWREGGERGFHGGRLRGISPSTHDPIRVHGVAWVGLDRAPHGPSNEPTLPEIRPSSTGPWDSSKYRWTLPAARRAVGTGSARAVGESCPSRNAPRAPGGQQVDPAGIASLAWQPVRRSIPGATFRFPLDLHLPVSAFPLPRLVNRLRYRPAWGLAAKDQGFHALCSHVETSHHEPQRLVPHAFLRPNRDVSMCSPCARTSRTFDSLLPTA